MKTKGKILVINSDEDTMSLLKDLLQESNYDAEYSSDYDHIKEIVGNFAPDLLVIDMMERPVAEEIKSDESFADIPLLYMTGYSGKTKVNYPFADDVIEKPFDLEIFEDKIDKLIKGREKTSP